MGDVGDELNLILSTKILSIAVLESVLILIAKFTVFVKLYDAASQFFLLICLCAYCKHYLFYLLV
jgi:hypothetical protein